jgi:hypothetical protein
MFPVKRLNVFNRQGSVSTIIGFMIESFFSSSCAGPNFQGCAVVVVVTKLMHPMAHYFFGVVVVMIGTDVVSQVLVYYEGSCNGLHKSARLNAAKRQGLLGKESKAVWVFLLQACLND